MNETELILQNLQNDCSEIVDVYRKTQQKYEYPYLYSGKGNRREICFKGIIPTVRTSAQMSQHEHDVFNDVLMLKGFRAHRGNSIFCTRHQIAQNYGEVYIIFPFNGFKYTWFLNQTTTYVVFQIEDDIAGSKTADTGIDHLESIISDSIDRLSPQKTNLETAIGMENEILISGTYYYAVNYKNRFILENL